MNKKVFYLFLGILAIVMASCGDSAKGVSRVSGWYLAEWSGTASDYKEAIKFINSNTLINYGIIETWSGTKNWASWINWEKLPEKDGYYYDDRAGNPYTYYIEGNKIYWGKDELHIMTIHEDGSLQEDGSKKIYKKW